MSKRILTIGLMVATLVVSSSAFASRARLSVMGGGFGASQVIDRGSLYYDDNHNVFYNPSYVNDFKNWATIEKSNGAGAASAAEGGFFMNVMNFNLGLYMNRGDAITSAFGSVRPLEVFVGSDMGVKWGVSASFAGNRVNDDTGSTDIHLKAGVQVANFEPFANFKIVGSQKATGVTTNGKHADMGLGLRYKGLGEWQPYAALRKVKSTALGGAESKGSALGIGMGRSMKATEGVKVNSAISYWSFSNGGATAGTKKAQLPIDLSVEGDATDWLSLRAGLQYSFMDRIDNVTQAAAPTGSIGATIKVKKVSFDWAVGHSANAAAEDLQGSGFGLDTGFFTAGSLTYHM